MFFLHGMQTPMDSISLLQSRFRNRGSWRPTERWILLNTPLLCVRLEEREAKVQRVGVEAWCLRLNQSWAETVRFMPSLLIRFYLAGYWRARVLASCNYAKHVNDFCFCSLTVTVGERWEHHHGNPLWAWVQVKNIYCQSSFLCFHWSCHSQSKKGMHLQHTHRERNRILWASLII